MQKSENINELAAALSKLQGALIPVKKDSENPFYKHKYADLSSVWDACHKLLAENGLAVAQGSRTEEDEVILVTTLMHTSGQWIEGEYLLNPIKDDPQGLGSAMTYARRYTLSAMLGITAEDEDDDAEVASGRGKQSQQSKATSPDLATDAQRKKIFASMKERGYTEEQLKAWVMSQYGKESTKDLTKKEASEVIEAILDSKIPAGEKQEDLFEEGG